MQCVPSTHNLFHAPRARARHNPAVVLLLSNTCGLMTKFLLVSKLKRQLCSSVELEVNQSNKLLTWLWKLHLPRWSGRCCASVCSCCCKPTEGGGMRGPSLAKLLLTTGERLMGGSAVSSQRSVCPPPTLGMYMMTREGRTVPIQQHRHTWYTPHTQYTQCIQRRAHVSLIVPRCKYSQLSRFIFVRTCGSSLKSARVHVLFLLPQNPQFRKSKVQIHPAD